MGYSHNQNGISFGGDPKTRDIEYSEGFETALSAVGESLRTQAFADMTLLHNDLKSIRSQPRELMRKFKTEKIVVVHIFHPQTEELLGKMAYVALRRGRLERLRYVLTLTQWDRVMYPTFLKFVDIVEL